MGGFGWGEVLALMAMVVLHMRSHVSQWLVCRRSSGWADACDSGPGRCVPCLSCIRCYVAGLT